VTVEAIKEAITALPEEERVALAAWLHEQTMDAWDVEMARDFSPGGRGMGFLEEVRLEIAEGKSRPMEEGWAQRRKPRA
jgi:hypothetical protein